MKYWILVFLPSLCLASNNFVFHHPLNNIEDYLEIEKAPAFRKYQYSCSSKHIQRDLKSKKTRAIEYVTNGVITQNYIPSKNILITQKEATFNHSESNSYNYHSKSTQKFTRIDSTTIKMVVEVEDIFLKKSDQTEKVQKSQIEKSLNLENGALKTLSFSVNGKAANDHWQRITSRFDSLSTKYITTAIHKNPSLLNTTSIEKLSLTQACIYQQIDFEGLISLTEKSLIGEWKNVDELTLVKSFKVFSDGVVEITKGDETKLKASYDVEGNSFTLYTDDQMVKKSHHKITFQGINKLFINSSVKNYDFGANSTFKRLVK
ncbi:MAG: hypothetical protein HOE90_04370 [Bacteriovoracaceae bacterium]|jgi:hypothetical protein|nr:hypothetical protein [Bacteriovoracaceae bacterium]